jgi:hypothetical protein
MPPWKAVAGLVLAAICGLVRPLSAEINVEASLEAHCLEADLVAYGFPEGVEALPEPSSGGWGSWKFQVAISELLKKPAGFKAERLTLDRQSCNTFHSQALLEKKPVLVFLKADEKGELKPMPQPYTGWIPVVAWPGDRAFVIADRNLQLIKDPEQMLPLAREWSKSRVKENFAREATRDEDTNELRYHISMRSACYLMVPADDHQRERLLALAVSKNPQERYRAAREMANCPGEQITQCLLKLLEDPATQQTAASTDLWVEDVFYVRSEAHRALLSSSRESPYRVNEAPAWKVELRRPATENGRRAYRHERWSSLLTHAFQATGWTIGAPRDLDPVPVVIPEGRVPSAGTYQRYILEIPVTNPTGTHSVVMVPDEIGDEPPAVDGHELLSRTSTYDAYLYVNPTFPKEGREALLKTFPNK